MRIDGELTLRQLTEEQRKALEAWLLAHWGDGGPVTALHEVGQPRHLLRLTYTSLLRLVHELEPKAGRPWYAAPTRRNAR